jgi:hypothetical protein
MTDENDPADDRRPTADRDYEVGYGKPPVHTRFGQGNRASQGRPSGSRNVRTIFNEAFSQRANAEIGGERVSISRAELTLRQLAVAASKGDPKATAQYLHYADKWAEADVEPEKLPDAVISADHDIVQNLFALAKLTDVVETRPLEDDQDV